MKTRNKYFRLAVKESICTRTFNFALTQINSFSVTFRNLSKGRTLNSPITANSKHQSYVSSNYYSFSNLVLTTLKCH